MLFRKYFILVLQVFTIFFTVFAVLSLFCLAYWPTDRRVAVAGKQFSSILNVRIITVWTVVQTVLTATFNSYGDRQISTPYNISIQYPWTNRKKIRHSWLRPRGESVYQNRYKSTHWGLLGNWVKYNKKLFIYTFFSETRVQVRPVDGFFRAIAH